MQLLCYSADIYFMPTHQGYIVECFFSKVALFLIHKYDAGVPNKGLGDFCFSSWNDDEFFGGGDKFVHVFFTSAFLHCQLALFSFSYAHTTYISQLGMSVNYLN